MRYHGQEHTVKVPILSANFADDLTSLRRRLDTLHHRAYALSLPESAAEIVNLQVPILGITKKPVLKRLSAEPKGIALKGKRSITIREYGAGIDVEVYDRDRLTAGSVIQGAAIIEEWSSTILLLPEQTATVDDFGNLIIKRVDK